MKNKKWYEVFKAGTHKDSSGKEQTFTESDITEIADTYNNQKEHSAPLVKGHPKTNDPAYGWVSEAKAENGSLFVSFSDLSKEMIEDVRDGKFKFTSISLYPNKLLRHVGMLGAVPPAVKGLAPINFSADKETEFTTFDFSEMWELRGIINSIGETFQSLRDEIIAKDGIDTANLKISQYMIDRCKQFEGIDFPVTSMQATLNNYNENNNKDNEMEKTLEELKKENEELQAKVKKMEEDKTSSEENNFCEGLIKEGKLLPADKDQTLLILKNLRSSETIDFSEKKTTAYDVYKDSLTARTPVINFTETGDPGSNSVADPYAAEGDKIAKSINQK